MVNPLKLKFMVILFGIILLVLGAIGFLLHDRCGSDVSGLTSDIEGGMTESMTIKARETGGAVFTAIAEFFVAILCPVLNFIDGLIGVILPFNISTFAILVIIGVIMVVVGWFVVP